MTEWHQRNYALKVCHQKCTKFGTVKNSECFELCLGRPCIRIKRLLTNWARICHSFPNSRSLLGCSEGTNSQCGLLPKRGIMGNISTMVYHSNAQLSLADAGEIRGLVTSGIPASGDYVTPVVPATVCSIVTAENAEVQRRERKTTLRIRVGIFIGGKGSVTRKVRIELALKTGWDWWYRWIW